MKELVIAADRNNLLKVQSFIDEQLEDAGCPMLTQIAIDVALGAKERKKAGRASIWSRTAWTICAMNTGTERISLP